MSTPAVFQIQNALVTLLDAALASSIIVDRASNEPVADSEIPAVVVNPGDQSYFEFDLSTTGHNAEFGLDIYERKTLAKSISRMQQDTIALIVAALAADPTLGGMVQTMEPQNASSPDGNSADIGSVTLTIRIDYFTPRGDFNTIIGQSGLFT